MNIKSRFTLSLPITPGSPCVDEITPDYWVIPDERLIPEFTARGIPEDRLLPLGIPTNPAMAAHVDRNVARRLLHLPQQGRWCW